jgi:hypothetical protein
MENDNRLERALGLLRTCAATLAIVALLSLSARADIITLNDGTTIEGTAIKEGDQYWVKPANGQARRIPVSQVKSIRQPPIDYGDRPATTRPAATEKLAPFGVPGPPPHCAYVLDLSRDGGDAPATFTRAVKGDLATLKPYQTLRVIIAAEGQPSQLDPNALPATAENLRRANEFLDGAKPIAGKSDLAGALRLAMSAKPNVIFLLLNASTSPEEVDRLNELARSLDPAREVTLNVLVFNTPLEAAAIKMAREGKGRFLVLPGEAAK